MQNCRENLLLRSNLGKEGVKLTNRILFLSEIERTLLIQLPIKCQTRNFVVCDQSVVKQPLVMNKAVPLVTDLDGLVEAHMDSVEHSRVHRLFTFKGIKKSQFPAQSGVCTR